MPSHVALNKGSDLTFCAAFKMPCPSPQLSFNGVQYLERIGDGIHDAFDLTASLSRDQLSSNPHNSVSFLSKDTYLGLPQMKARRV